MLDAPHSGRGVSAGQGAARSHGWDAVLFRRVGCSPLPACVRLIVMLSTVSNMLCMDMYTFIQNLHTHTRLHALLSPHCHSLNATHSLSTHEHTHTPNRLPHYTNALGPSAQRAPHLNQTTHAAPPRAQRAAQPCHQGGGWLRSGVGASHQGGGQPRSEAGARGAGRRQGARPAQPARWRGP